MKTYIVSYDLRGSRDYDSLYEALKSYGTYAKIQESLWAVVTTQTASEIRDYLVKKGNLDSDDSLFVVKSGVNAAWRNVLCTDKWLKENL